MNSINPVFGDHLTSLFLDDNLTAARVPLSEIKEQTVTPTDVSDSVLTTTTPVSSEVNSVLPSTTAEVQPLATNAPTGADLIGRIIPIELPDTVNYGDRGSVTVHIINRGQALAQGPVTIKLWLSTDNNIDQNDVLLKTQVSRIRLGAGESTNVLLNYRNITSAIAPGAYQLVAEIDTNNRIVETNENNNVASKLVSAPNTDIVIDWNAAALNAIQAEGEAGRGIPPTAGSRLLAIMSTAIYDTVNAFLQTNNPYAVDLIAPANASLEAAVAGAAHQVLTTLIPQQTALLNQQLSYSRLQEIKDLPNNERAGDRFGRTVANQILALRSDDGSDNNTPYEPPTDEYIWRPKAPNYTVVGQNWGQVTPFAMVDVDDFSPDGLDCSPTVDPILYATEIEEVRLLGGRNNTNLTTLTRTADQTEIAVFWAYDRADTFRPYGQLNQIAEEIAIREGNSILDNARLFAALNVAMADAAIVAWEAKYKYMQPRPDDVIAGGIAANDGIASTVGDPNWRPLLDTPPFPDYISGHSIFGGAWAGVMSYFFGEDYNFTAVSQELPGVRRSFDSFYNAAYEDAISRIYGGVHTREATIVDSLPTGLNLGQYVAENLFQSVG